MGGRTTSSWFPTTLAGGRAGRGGAGKRLGWMGRQGVRQAGGWLGWAGRGVGGWGGLGRQAGGRLGRPAGHQGWVGRMLVHMGPSCPALLAGHP